MVKMSEKRRVWTIRGSQKDKDEHSTSQEERGKEGCGKRGVAPDETTA